MARITIGVPVYNGAALLAEALSCLERQTFADFEVVVRDNGSTDESGDIADTFARRDSRFSVVRSPNTIPAVQNFRAVLHLARAPLFAWRAYDDLSSDNFLEGLVAALDAAPTAWLATGAVETRKAHRGTARRRDVPRLSANETLAVLSLMRNVQASWYYGLWRRDIITPLFDEAAARFGHLWANDHATLFPLLLRRAVAFAPDVTFVQRLGFDPGRPPATYRPSTREAWIVARSLWSFCAASIGESPLSPAGKAAAYGVLPAFVNKRSTRVARLAQMWAGDRIASWRKPANAR